MPRWVRSVAPVALALHRECGCYVGSAATVVPFARGGGDTICWGTPVDRSLDNGQLHEMRHTAVSVVHLE